MLICTVESLVASTWMKPLIFRTSRVLPPPAAKDKRAGHRGFVHDVVPGRALGLRRPNQRHPNDQGRQGSCRHARWMGQPPNLVGRPGYPSPMAKAKKRAPRRKKAAAGSFGLTVIETADRRRKGTPRSHLGRKGRCRRRPGDVSRPIRRHAGAARLAADRQGRADAVSARSVRHAHQEADDGDRKGRPLPRSAGADSPGRRLLDTERQSSPAGDEETRREEHHRVARAGSGGRVQDPRAQYGEGAQRQGEVARDHSHGPRAGRSTRGARRRTSPSSSSRRSSSRSARPTSSARA